MNILITLILHYQKTTKSIWKLAFQSANSREQICFNPPIISATLKYMYSIFYSSHAVTIVCDKSIFEIFKRALPQVKT